MRLQPPGGLGQEPREPKGPIITDRDVRIIQNVTYGFAGALNILAGAALISPEVNQAISGVLDTQTALDTSMKLSELNTLPALAGLTSVLFRYVPKVLEFTGVIWGIETIEEFVARNSHLFSADNLIIPAYFVTEIGHFLVRSLAS